MTAERLSGAELKALLRDRSGLALLRELCPGGRMEGKLYSCLAPHRPDKTRGSFKIYTDSHRFGGFVDYGSDTRGDLIDLIALVKGTDVPGALDWARAHLGLGVLDPKKIRAVKREAAALGKKGTEEAEAAAARKRERAFKIYLQAVPLLERASPEARAVLAYLAGRGIVPERISRLTRDVRVTMLEHWQSAVYREGRKVTPGWFGPVLVCGIRDKKGLVRAVHCTWVTREGRDKAPVDSPKLMLGDVAGGVIQLTAGVIDAEGGLVPATVALCEGVEDGLSLAMAEDVRIWAVTSLGNLGNAPIDLPSVRDVVVLQDNDWDKRQALEAFELALERLQGHGKKIAVMSSHIGKDFNDMLRKNG